MFSSTTGPNLFPVLSPPPFLGSDAATDFFLHLYHDHVHDHSDLLTANAPFGMVVSNQEASCELNGQNFGPKSTVPKTKKAAKKHKHSKIFTAQGLRDRRVRLSIEVARKFFDLQDMLGFEKASKTIDWLLKNSEAGIEGLMMMNKVKGSSSGGGVKRISTLSSVDVKGEKVNIRKVRAALVDGYLVSRESRARARERARERTREKILRSLKLKGSPISSDEQKISDDNFKFVPSFGRPATSPANGNVV